MRKIIGLTGLVACLVLVSWAEAGKEEDAAKYVKDFKTSTKASVKIEAAKNIGDLGQIKKSWVVDAVPDLVKACKDSDAKLRAAAAEALGKIDPPAESKAIETLTDLVKNDKDAAVQQAAARGLAYMGPAARSALPTLREAAKKTDNKKQSKTFMDAAKAIGGKK